MSTDIRRHRVIHEDGTMEVHFYDEFLRTYLVYMISSREYLRKFLDSSGYKESQLEDMNLETASGYVIRMNEETCNTNQNFFLLWQQEKHIPCLAHEVTHLTLMSFDEKAIPIAIQNQETVAYFLEHWMKRILESWDYPVNKRDKLNHKESKDARSRTATKQSRSSASAPDNGTEDGGPAV